MKKKVLSLLVVSAILASCQKTELKETITEDASIEQLTQLSLDYQKDHRFNGDRAGGKWRRIIAADCTGALAGGATGGGIGALAGPGGVGVGALIGGLLGGTAASLTAADNETGVGPGADVDFFNPVYEIEVGELTGNGSNPFDHIGRNHYLSINNFVIEVECAVEEDMSEFYAQTSDFIEDEYAPAYEIESLYTLDDCNTTVAFAIDLGNFQNGVTELFDSEEISSTVKSVLYNYAVAFDITEQEDLEDFVTYSIDAENIVVDDRRMSALDKQLILGTMATARYGAQYWDFFVAE